MKKKLPKELFDKIVADLPPVFPRADIGKYLCGLIKPQTLRNIEQQTGQPRSYKLGTRNVYDREEFVAWLGDYYGITGTGTEVQGSPGDSQTTGSQSEGTEDTSRGTVGDTDTADNVRE